MTDETRRRQKREELVAKAKKMQQADNIKRIIENRRNLKGPYSPERCKEQLRDLFTGKHHKATIE